VPTPREVSESYWAAECRRDIDDVLEHYHPDAVYEDSSGRYQGLAAIRGFYESSATSFPGLDVTIVGEIADGDESALEFVAVLVDLVGRRSIIRGVNLVRVRDGRFASVRSYEDPLVPEATLEPGS
jgi:ketosteroid isomerase-like protein